MTLIIHTAEIKPSAHERILTASLEKRDVLDQVKSWRRDYPGRKITYRTIVEEVER